MATTIITTALGVLGLAVHYVMAGIINSHGKIEWAARRLLSNGTEPEPEKTIWQKIEEFYDDKNNFAMYMVLPCIVLVYGGCSVIYCIAKCRQFFKKKKKPRGLPDQEDDGEVDCDDIQTTNSGRPDESGRQSSTARSTSDVRVGVEREQSTPLPWQVPDKDTDEQAKEKNDVKEAKPKNPLTNQSPPPPYDDVEEIGAAAPIPKKQPLGEKPVISSVSNRGNDMAYNNAKYAAMLLRLDEHNRGRSGYKNAGRRLVFIAE